MNSYHVGFSECAHERASNGQHVRKQFFNRSAAACQEQNSHQIQSIASGAYLAKKDRFQAVLTALGQRLADERGQVCQRVGPT
jgi:hypothetical protein